MLECELLSSENDAHEQHTACKLTLFQHQQQWCVVMLSELHEPLFEFRGKVSTLCSVGLPEEVLTRLEIPANCKVAYLYPDPALGCKPPIPGISDLEYAVEHKTAHKRHRVRQLILSHEPRLRLLGRLLSVGGFAYLTSNQAGVYSLDAVKACTDCSESSGAQELSLCAWEILPAAVEIQIQHRFQAMPLSALRYKPATSGTVSDVICSFGWVGSTEQFEYKDEQSTGFSFGTVQYPTGGFVFKFGDGSRSVILPVARRGRSDVRSELFRSHIGRARCLEAWGRLRRMYHSSSNMFQATVLKTDQVLIKVCWRESCGTERWVQAGSWFCLETGADGRYDIPDDKFALLYDTHCPTRIEDLSLNQQSLMPKYRDAIELNTQLPAHNQMMLYGTLTPKKVILVTQAHMDHFKRKYPESMQSVGPGAITVPMHHAPSNLDLYNSASGKLQTNEWHITEIQKFGLFARRLCEAESLERRDTSHDDSEIGTDLFVFKAPLHWGQQRAQLMYVAIGDCLTLDNTQQRAVITVIGGVSLCTNYETITRHRIGAPPTSPVLSACLDITQHLQQPSQQPAEERQPFQQQRPAQQQPGHHQLPPISSPLRTQIMTPHSKLSIHEPDPLVVTVNKMIIKAPRGSGKLRF
jgi:hypothetical protein